MKALKLKNLLEEAKREKQFFQQKLEKANKKIIELSNKLNRIAAVLKGEE